MELDQDQDPPLFLSLVLHEQQKKEIVFSIARRGSIPQVTRRTNEKNRLYSSISFEVVEEFEIFGD